MFKNRSLQVKMIKDDEASTDVIVANDTFENKAIIVGEQVKNILMMVGTGVIAYVAADAIRQIAVERAKRY